MSASREEAINTLVYQAANAIAEEAINAGKGMDFLLANGWLPFSIERAIKKEMGKASGCNPEEKYNEQI